MRSLHYLSVLTAILSPGALASLDYLPKADLCAAGCAVSLFSVSFDGMPPAAEMGTGANPVACADPLWAQSLFYCANTYCHPANLQRALDAQNETCAFYGSILPPYSVSNSQNVTTVSQMQAMGSTYRNAVIPNRAFYREGYLSYKYYNYSQYVSWDATWGLYGFWGLVLIIGIGNRLLHLARSFRSPSPIPIEAASTSTVQQSRSPLARSSTWFSRRLAIPFAFGTSKWIPAGYCSLPTRLETFLIVFYLVLNFVLCFPGYHLYSQDILYPETKMQLGRYVALRLGSLAISNVPVVWLFAARNDPLLWITGWSYATYSQFHRWSARILLALAISHATAMSVFTAYSGQMAYYELFQQQFVQLGLVALLSFSIMVGTSFYFMRNRLYDLWLIIHFVFAIVALVGLFYHTMEEDGHYDGFLWFAVAIWAFDRLLRYSRLAYRNLIPVAKGARATATYDPDVDMVRANVTDYFQNAKPVPGMFYFIYEPARIRGYESHPFSLCSWPQIDPARRGSAAKSTDSPEPKDEKEADVDNTSTSSPADAAVTGNSSSSSSPTQHTFLIKPRQGFTRRLRHKASHPTHPTTTQIPVLIEGPYGTNLHLDKYPNVTMIVGGSGITAAVSRVHYLLTAPSASTTRVHLVWAVQRTALAVDVARHELAAVLAHPRFRLDVYVTQAGKSGMEAEDAATTVLPKAVIAGRPEIGKILEEERAQCGGGKLAVLCCGPPPLENDCRNAVVRLMGEPGAKVEFFDERFGW